MTQQLVALIALASLLTSCANGESKAVVDVATCTERVKTELYSRRNLIPSGDKGPEFYVLRGPIGHDSELAVAFMERNGWHAWASDKPDDQDRFYFVPDKQPFRPGAPVGELEEGPRLACQASKLSGLVFEKVLRRSTDLTQLVYEFTL